MEINCSQMEVLITFYLEGDLSKTLREKVEEHLAKCQVCRAKYDIIKSMFYDIKQASLEENSTEIPFEDNSQYNLFKNNISAYLDNELSTEDNIKIKKMTINNKKARQILQDNYNLRKLMNDSFNKTKSNVKNDYSKKILKELNKNDEYNLGFHPLLKVAIAFIITVLLMSGIIVFYLTL